MYTEYNYMNMSTIEKLLLNHTLILVCILNIITYIYIYKYNRNFENNFHY